MSSFRIRRFSLRSSSRKISSSWFKGMTTPGSIKVMVPVVEEPKTLPFTRLLYVLSTANALRLFTNPSRMSASMSFPCSSFMTLLKLRLILRLNPVISSRIVLRVGEALSEIWPLASKTFAMGSMRSFV